MSVRVSVVSGLAVLCLVSLLAPAASAQTAPTPDPALAAVFAGESLPQADLMPKPVLKCGPICIGSIHFTTATISGSGPDCTSAQNSLNSQLQSIARAHCVNDEGFLGSCNVVIHNTTSCTLIAPGTYQIQGYATYNCKDTTC
jgi:hypothetical protein